MSNGQLRDRIILLLIGLFLGILLGLLLNLMRFLFQSIVLGWGDSAPEWYFNIQDEVETFVFVMSIVAGMVWSQLFYRYVRQRGRL